MLKKVLKKSFKKMGYQVKRLPAERNVNEDVCIELYGYRLKINTSNPLSSWYKKYPKYNSELARATKVVLGKYENLGAIDIGANIGDTMSVIKSAGDVKLLCIEGDPFVYNYLQENSRQFDNVETKYTFLSDTADTITANIEKDGWNATIVPGDKADSRKIKTSTLDEVVSEIPGAGDYKLLKVDTEGFDTKILRGAVNYLKEVKPVIFLEYNRHNMDAIGEKGLDTLHLLKEIGYSRVLVYESNGRFILPITLNDTSILHHLHNYIDGINSTIYYFDFCIFHETDDDIASVFVKDEEAHRLKN